ncbi:MAG: tetratricopeptide repeat protein [Proteobacteria bacterium]|nr:tetratricopeptide repeat protein [Pseudomonadota bacterium]
MFRPVSLLVLAAACALGAPALAQNVDQSKIGPSVEQRSLYGAFLAGREAMREGDAQTGAQLLVGAANTEPADSLLRDRAFTAALIAGDVGSAARFAPPATEPASPVRDLGRVTRAIEALSIGKGDALAELSAPVAAPHHAAAMLLTPYAQAAAGQWDKATAPHDADGERLVELLDRAARAQLLELHGQTAEAEVLYKGLATDPFAAALYQTSYGEFLERRGRWEDAIAFYNEAMKGPAADAALVQARQRALRHDRPPAAPDIRHGAAQAMSYASAAMGAGRQAELSLIYAYLALRLDPGLDQAYVFAGDAMVLAHNEAEARAAWDKVRPGSGYYAEARLRTAYSFQRSGDIPAGLQALRMVMSAAPMNLQAQYSYADLLQTHGDYAESAQMLDKLVAEGGDRDWRVLFMRAGVRDKLGRWDEAKADLDAAIAIAPNEPDLLNYLGYNLIDRGEDVPRGMSLVERAVAGRPNSGAMKDSLGWAHYRLGDYAKAVEVLEAAVLLDPSDAATNDHLGDAYWRVGRKDEAGFQWRRVLTLQAEASLKASVEAKLRDGLKDAGETKRAGL